MTSSYKDCRSSSRAGVRNLFHDFLRSILLLPSILYNPFIPEVFTRQMAPISRYPACTCAGSGEDGADVQPRSRSCNRGRYRTLYVEEIPDVVEPGVVYAVGETER